MASSLCPAGQLLAQSPGATRGSLPPQVPSELVTTSRKHIPKPQVGFFFLHTASSTVLLHHEQRIRTAGSELSIS